MTAEPAVPGPDTGSYEMIHLGDQAAVVVPVAVRIRSTPRTRSAFRGWPSFYRCRARSRSGQ